MTSKQHVNMYDLKEEEIVYPCSFEAYKSVADDMYHKGNHAQAIEKYSIALSIVPDDPSVLVRRSECRLKIGETKLALEDAEASLVDDKTFYKGIFQKAEALFYDGEFEMALVNYHRGKRQRPELQEFSLGIKKAQNAIMSCVGTPDIVKLDLSGDLSFFKKYEVKSREHKLKHHVSKKSLDQKPPVKVKRNTVRSRQHDWTIRNMLADLYGGKVWLETFLKDTDETTQTGQQVAELTEGGLDFLDVRTDFWQQAKPMYARKYEKRQALARAMTKFIPSKMTPHEHALRELDNLDALMEQGMYSMVLRRANTFMRILSSYTEAQLANLNSFVAKVVSFQGNAHLELKDYVKAVSDHHMDVNIGIEHNIPEAESRGLENLGRTLARMGEYRKAIAVWERKLPLCKTHLETTWLCHELGRCYLEINRTTEAKEYGKKSLAAAKEADDDVWKLHALVLMSQTDVKAKRYSSSMFTFEQAYQLADILRDEGAQAAIKKAMRDVRWNEKERNEWSPPKEEEAKQEGASSTIYGWFSRRVSGAGNTSASNYKIEGLENQGIWNTGSKNTECNQEYHGDECSQEHFEYKEYREHGFGDTEDNACSHEDNEDSECQEDSEDRECYREDSENNECSREDTNDKEGSQEDSDDSECSQENVQDNKCSHGVNIDNGCGHEDNIGNEYSHEGDIDNECSHEKGDIDNKCSHEERDIDNECSHEDNIDKECSHDYEDGDIDNEYSHGGNIDKE